MATRFHHINFCSKNPSNSKFNVLWLFVDVPVPCSGGLSGETGDACGQGGRIAAAAMDCSR
jgi:hypothetical protein